MREILFRALSMCRGEHWVYGQPRHYARNPHTEKWTIYDPNTGIETDIDEETIGQYTGILDKDGNKIFEGDVVECVSWNEYFSDPTTGKVMEPFRRKMEVVFMAGGFKLVEYLPQPCIDNVWNTIVEGDLTVIGNIFDSNLEENK